MSAYDDDDASDSTSLLNKGNDDRGIDVDEDAEEERIPESQKSVLDGLLNHPASEIQFAGYCLAFAVGFELLASALMIFYGITRLDLACDEPLQIFFILFGIVMAFQGALLAIQVATATSKSTLKRLMNAAYAPAVLELVLVIIGTVWLEQSERCNVSLKGHASWVIGVVWFLVLTGCCMHIYQYLQEQPMPAQRWR